MSEGSPFFSVLFPPDAADMALAQSEPAYFTDLNLDQLVVQFCRGRSLERLQPLFWTRLGSVGAVRYRQDAIREIEEPGAADAMAHFTVGFSQVVQQLNLRRHTRYQWPQKRCLVDAAQAYCHAVATLSMDLAAVEPRCAALRGLRDYLESYVGSPDFTRLRDDVSHTLEQLDSVTYLLQIRGNRAHIMVPHDEPDLGAKVADLFSRFRDMEVTTEAVSYRRPGGFSHIDAAILNEVADLFPEQFGDLARFDADHGDFLDPTVVRFAGELEFVLACLQFKARMEADELPMCYPQVMEDAAHTHAVACYDAALASSPAVEARSSRSRRRGVVRNSFELNEDERLIVVTGPNQGGKTTFARMFGQLHHLASLGCPVPAHSARLGLVDDIFTLFERQEDAGSDRGKLQDDLVRMRHILDNATELSVVVLNEMFSSTTTDDALDLATRVLNPLLDRRCRGICVTFLDELADYRAGVVSMVADVDRDDPGRRLFTLSRRPADGRAYTESLVAKYQLSPYDIKRRVLR